MSILRVLLQTVGLALAQIRVNKFRAMLTALGIILGVSSVTAVIAALTGMKESVLSEVESFGAKKMWLWGEVPRAKRGVMEWEEVLITSDEADAIREHAPSIDCLTQITNTSSTVQFGQIVRTAVPVTGIEPAWHEIEDRYVVMGRPLTLPDGEFERQVCLINEKAIDELRLDRDPVGDSIVLAGRRFQIVGVLETKSVSAMFGGGETQIEIFVPFQTMQKIEEFSWPYIMAQITSPERAEEARAEIAFVLRKERGLTPDDEDTFEMQILQTEIDRFNSLTGAITAVAGGVVSISLLVGGIGIMNIMLVSVSERTREIGLRKAVGARPAVILMQFLTEAVVLCVAGGFIGVVVGQAMTMAIQRIPDAGLDEAVIPPWAIGLAFAFSAFVGVVFGMFPAIKASRLDPIVALRKD